MPKKQTNANDALVAKKVTQAEIDALRAKRAFEEGERQAREREKLENAKRVRIQADLEKAR